MASAKTIKRKLKRAKAKAKRTGRAQAVTNQAQQNVQANPAHYKAKYGVTYPTFSQYAQAAQAMAQALHVAFSVSAASFLSGLHTINPGGKMPRRHRFGFARKPKVPKPPKPPKVPKPARPKTKDLRIICKGLVTTDIGQRINSLLYILQWYDGAIIYLTFMQKGQLTPEQRKSIDRVHKARLQGQGTTFNDEKETAYKTAIRILEKLTDQLLSPPKVDDFYKILENKKPNMEKKAENWMAKYGQTVQAMQDALQPKNAQGDKIEISIGPVQEEVQKDAELRRFVLRPDIAKQLHQKRQREGLLPMVMEPLVIEELARLAAMEKEVDQNNTWTGRWQAGALKQRAAVIQMLRNLIGYAQLPEAPKRLVRVAVTQPINGQLPQQPPRAPRAPRVGFGRAPQGPLVEGMFIENSTAHQLYELLKDGKPWSKKELRIKTGKSAINGSLKKMAGLVNQKGFKLEITGNQVTLQTGGQP